MKLLFSTLLLLAGLTSYAQFAHSQSISLTAGGTNTTVGTPSTNGAATSAAGVAATFTCTGTAPMSISAYSGAITQVNQTPVAEAVSSTNTVSVTTAMLPPDQQNAVQCDSNGTFAGLFDTVTANPSLSWINASQIVDASYVPLVKGKICFTPVDANGNAAPFEFPFSGTVRPIPVCRTVANGAITVQLMLARSNLTTPVGINYQIAVTDSTTGATQNLGTAAITGDTWNLGDFAPSTVQTAPPAAWVVGPQGPQGVPGPAGTSSAAGAVGTVQVAGAGGQLAAGTPDELLADLPYTPLNPTNNLSDLASTSTALANLGGEPKSYIDAADQANATAASNAQTAANAAQTTANNALPKTGGTVTGNLALPTTTTIGGSVVCTAAGGAACPAGGTASASGSQYAMQIAGASNTFDNDAAVTVDKTSHSIIAAGPRLNVRDTLFATGWTIGSTTQASCAGVSGNTSGAADPTDTYNSTCAIKSAMAYSAAWSAAHPGIGFPVIYFPTGRYWIESDTLTAALEVDYLMSFEGDGQDDSFLDNSHSAKATAIFYSAVNGACPTSNAYCSPFVRNLSIIGSGHSGIGGGIEATNIVNFYVTNVGLSNIGGQSLNIQQSTERAYFTHMDISNASRAVNMSHNTNEDYFERVNVVNPGADTSGYCYSTINCTNGVPHAQGTSASPTPWYVEPRASVLMNGDNIHWNNSSVKGLTWESGIDLGYSSADASISHTYLEGSPYAGSTPRLNHAIEAIGESEIGHTTAAMTTTSLTVGVDDAIWHSQYINDPSFLPGAVIGATYRIVPCDYIAGSTAASTCPGMSSITQGTYEDVVVDGFAGDQEMHIGSRAQDGTAAVAWPTGAAFVEVISGPYGTLTLEGNHINATNIDAYGSGYSLACSDTAQHPLTSSTNSEACSDIMTMVPDGIQMPFPSASGYDTVSTNLQLTGNSMYFGGGEVYGQGYVKIPGNADVSYSPSDAIPSNGQYSIPNIIAGMYSNGFNNVQFINWGTVASPHFALGFVNDPGAGVRFSPSSGNFFTGKFLDTENGGVIATQLYSPNNSCEEWGAYPNATAPTHTLFRSCHYPTGASMDTWNGSTWANVHAETATANTTALPLVPNGGITFPGTYNYPTNSISVTNNLIATVTSGNVYTLPAATPAGTRIRLTLTGAAPFSIATPSGNKMYMNNTQYTSTSGVAFPGGESVTIEWTADVYNDWISTGYLPELGAVTVTSGSGSPTLASGSSVHAGSFTFTPSAAIAAGSTALTFAFTTPTANLAKACSLVPQNANAASVIADYYPTITGSSTTTGWTVTMGATAWPAQAYSFGYHCDF